MAPSLLYLVLHKQHPLQHVVLPCSSTCSTYQLVLPARLAGCSCSVSTLCSGRTTASNIVVCGFTAGVAPKHQVKLPDMTLLLEQIDKLIVLRQLKVPNACQQHDLDMLQLAVEDGLEVLVDNNLRYCGDVDAVQGAEVRQFGRS